MSVGRRVRPSRRNFGFETHADAHFEGILAGLLLIRQFHVPAVEGEIDAVFGICLGVECSGLAREGMLI